MSSQRRTTQSANASIPDIPLPARRAAPTKKKGDRNEKQSAPARRGAPTKKTENQNEKRSEKVDQRQRALVQDVEEISIHDTEAINPEPQSRASPPPVNPTTPIQTLLEDSTSERSLIIHAENHTTQPSSAPRSRPRPVPKSRRATGNLEDAEAEYFSSFRGAGYQYRESTQPHHEGSLPLVPLNNSNHLTGVRSAEKPTTTREFVNSVGITVELDSTDSSSDDEGHFTLYRPESRRPNYLRNSTPAPGNTDVNDKNPQHDVRIHAVYHRHEHVIGASTSSENQSLQPQTSHVVQVAESTQRNPDESMDNELEDSCVSDVQIEEEPADSGEDNEPHRATEDEIQNTPEDVADEEALETPQGAGYDSEGSGSDFEETAAEERKRKEYKASYRRSVSPTMSEQDREDENEFEKTLLPSPPRIPASRKGKGRARSPVRETSESDTSNDEGEDANQKSPTPYSSGPISNEAKEAAYALHKTFVQGLEEIARQCNKPVKHFFALVGAEPPSTRTLTSPWDVYQRWFSAVNKKPTDVSIQLWTKEVASEYNKELRILKDKFDGAAPTRQQIEEHFKLQFEFSRDSTKNYLMAKRESKKFAAVVSKVIEPFIRLSTKASEEYGIHVFGFAVETSPESCSSVAWGGSNAYKTLRDQHKTVIQTQLHDYEGLFKVAEMQGRANPMSKLKFFVDTRKKDNELDRDYLRRILGEFLRSDLARIFSEHDGSTASNAMHSKTKMNWSWTDYAYKNELRIVGWDKGVAFPKKQFDPKKITHETLKKMVKPRIVWYQQRLQAGHEDSDDGEIEADTDDAFQKLVQIVSWTQEEMSARLKDKGSIPLVVDVDGCNLLKVFDCDLYVASMRNTGVAISVLNPDVQIIETEPAVEKRSKKRKREAPVVAPVSQNSHHPTPAQPELNQTGSRPPVVDRLGDYEEPSTSHLSHPIQTRATDKQSQSQSVSRSYTRVEQVESSGENSQVHVQSGPSRVRTSSQSPIPNHSDQHPPMPTITQSQTTSQQQEALPHPAVSTSKFPTDFYTDRADKYGYAESRRERDNHDAEHQHDRQSRLYSEPRRPMHTINNNYNNDQPRNDYGEFSPSGLRSKIDGSLRDHRAESSNAPAAGIPRDRRSSIDDCESDWQGQKRRRLVQNEGLPRQASAGDHYQHYQQGPPPSRQSYYSQPEDNYPPSSVYHNRRDQSQARQGGASLNDYNYDQPYLYDSNMYDR